MEGYSDIVIYIDILDIVIGVELSKVGLTVLVVDPASRIMD